MLRHLRVGVALGALACLVLAAAAQASDQSQYESAKKKYFTDNLTNPKTLCICRDGGANDGRIGILREWSLNRAACYFPAFDAEGDYLGESPCSGSDFMVVGK